MDCDCKRPAARQATETAELAVSTDLPAVPIVTDAELDLIEPFLMELVDALLGQERD